MENILQNETLTYWLLNYGSIALFVLLALGILALPVPEETLMVISGILIYNEKLLTIPTIFAAIAGSICGITMSYLVGRTAGHFFLYKFAPKIGIKEHHLQTAHNWFERFGVWALFFGYFVPGVRHFTGVIAGTTELEYHRFALFAYCGAIVWASTFISLGYFFGDYVFSYIDKLHFEVDDIITILLFIAGIIAVWYLAKKAMKNKN